MQSLENSHNYVLIVAYDGTSFFGWQKTAMGPSIESSLEKALSHFLKDTPTLQAASRTDRGVHAKGQVVNFIHKGKPLEPKRIQKALNSLLPKSIRILDAFIAPLPFHPSLDSHQKTYIYQITPHPVQSPFMVPYSWHFYYPLDLELMRSAAQDLIGQKDFSAFTNQHNKKADPICTLSEISFVEGDLLSLIIKGDRFLYKMVRNIVGTLLYIGAGKLKGPLRELLEEGDRRLIGMTAPAHGLTLHQITYS